MVIRDPLCIEVNGKLTFPGRTLFMWLGERQKPDLTGWAWSRKEEPQRPRHSHALKLVSVPVAELAGRLMVSTQTHAWRQVGCVPPTVHWTAVCGSLCWAFWEITVIFSDFDTCTQRAAAGAPFLGPQKPTAPTNKATPDFLDSPSQISVQYQPL